jgi:regulator of sigma E protease
MEILVKAAQLLLSLSILVIVHEFGHFFFAKLFKTRVEKFYLFFDPWFSLFKIKKGETEYGIGWIPLGGYVKISGMIDESMDKEQMKQPPQPHEFRSKPAWQRLLIIIAGIMVNIFVAFLIYTMILYKWGDEYLPTENVKYGIACDSLAINMGFQNGDKILSVDNKKIEDFSQIVSTIFLNGSKTIEIDRQGNKQEITIPQGAVASLMRSKNTLFISPRIPFVVGKFTKNSLGKAAGLQTGDSIIRINNDTTVFFDQVRTTLGRYKNQTINLTVVRKGKELTLPVKLSSEAILGVYPMGDMSRYFSLKKIEYSFFEAIPAGLNKGVRTIDNYLKQLKLLITPKTKAYESLGGFLTIGSIFPGTWDWESFWSLTAFLSIVLAIMNILPIPGLDGGHMLFIVYEMVTGRKPGDKFMEYAQIVGMVLLVALLLYANINDIFKHLIK